MVSKKFLLDRVGSASRSIILLIVLSVIGSFPIAARRAAVTFTAAPASGTINAGQAAVFTININRDDYSDKITLNVSNLPPGSAASFSPNPVLGKSSVMTVTTQGSTPGGTYKLKVTGTAAGLTISPVLVTLVVKQAPRVTTSVRPAALSMIAGQAAEADFYIERSNYDGPVFLQAKDLPEGVSVSFGENPVYGSGTTARIYSHGTPHVWKEHRLRIESRWADLVSDIEFRLLINCGVEWVKQFGTSQTDARFTDVGPDGLTLVDGRNGDVAVDSAGNIYVAGSTLGTVDPQNPNQGGRDVWLAKYSNGGQLQWIKQIGTSGEDRATEVAADNAGNVFVGGFTAGEMPGNIHKGNMDYWIAKYDSGGNRLWVKQDGTQLQDGRFGFVIVPDGMGAGKFVTFTSAGNSERSRISTFTFNGVNGSLSPQGSINVPSIFRNTPYDLAIGPNDSVYVVGAFMNNGRPNEYVVKFDSSGNELWQNVYGSQDPKLATRITLDAAGNAYVAGRITPSPPALPHPKAWIAKYDAGTGGNLWTRYEPGEVYNLNDDVINAVGIDSYGDVIIAGSTEGVLGERNGDSGIPGVDDAWVSRRNGTTGDLVWVRQFAVSNLDGFDGVAFDSNKGMILSGYTVEFKSNIGSEDALLMRYVDSTQGTQVRLLPYITGIAPATEQAGRTIRINGVNFFGITGVRFNGVPALYTVVSLTQIDAVVPTGATTGLITISRNCSSFSSPAEFTVIP